MKATPQETIMVVDRWLSGIQNTLLWYQHGRGANKTPLLPEELFVIIFL